MIFLFLMNGPELSESSAKLKTEIRGLSFLGNTLPQDHAPEQRLPIHIASMSDLHCHDNKLGIP
ncbi:MAG: hypothetical protein ACRC9M_01085, partial [Aeromonas sp.]